MNEAKTILSKRGDQAVKAGRLFLDAICGDDRDHVESETPYATHAVTPERSLLIIDAELEDEGRKP